MYSSDLYVHYYFIWSLRTLYKLFDFVLNRLFAHSFKIFRKVMVISFTFLSVPQMMRKIQPKTALIIAAIVGRCSQYHRISFEGYLFGNRVQYYDYKSLQWMVQECQCSNRDKGFCINQFLGNKIVQGKDFSNPVN